MSEDHQGQGRQQNTGEANEEGNISIKRLMRMSNLYIKYAEPPIHVLNEDS